MLQSDETMENFVELTNEPLADMVTVVCSDDTYSILASKLTDNSHFFARALEVPMVEKKERKVMIKDIEGGIFEKVIKFMTEGAFQFDVETEAFEALEAADRLDMEELKEEVCNRIKDNLDIENAKAVLSLAERFSAEQLFKAAFDFMQENDLKLEKEDVVENPNLALAFMEEYRVMVAYMKEELDEKDELVEMYRKSGRRFYSGCDDIYDSFDDDDWHVFDSYEIEDDEEWEEGEQGEEEEEVYDISYLFEEKGDEQGDGKEDGRNGEDQSGAREKEEGGSGEKQEETLEDGMREKLENEKLKETDQSGTKEQQPEIFQSEKSGGGDA